MKHLIFYFLLLSIAGCSSINKSRINSAIKITIDSPMHAEVKVDMSKKLVGYAHGGYLFHLIRVSGDNKYVDDVRFNGKGGGWLSSLSRVNLVKGAATYNALRSGDADVLVNPQYVIESSNWNPFYKEVKVKVTGYYGKIVAIKNK